MTRQELLRLKEKLEKLNLEYEKSESVLPSQDFRFMEYYDEEAKDAMLPNSNSYQFLYERNKKYMNSTAITFANKKISYEEMHTRIDEYARALYKRGVRKADIIALCVANTPEAVYLNYALNKLGAVVCQINPMENIYKIARDLDVVCPKMFITINDSYKNIKNASKGTNIDIITFPAVQSIDNNLLHILYGVKQFISGNALFKINHNLKRILKSGKDFQDVIYDTTYQKGQLGNIVFTGGSSGTHKGVDLDSNGLNSVTRAIDFVAPLEPGEIFMGNLPQFMAFGIFTLHYALSRNLNLELTLKALPKDFISELKRIHPAGVFGGPIHWETLINNSDMIKDLDLTNLKLPVSGGEQLKIDKWKEINKVMAEHGCENGLWNGLGSSEMWAPTIVCRGGINTVGTIGTSIPFNNQKIVALDSEDELGYDQVGRLYLSGPGMMLGYHNNSEETKKVIKYDENGVKWLDTGDLAKISKNGEVTFVGRAKRCFVSGVDNIYPEQIEDLLTQFKEIRESIVTHVPSDKNQYSPIYHISIYDSNIDTKELEKKIENMILTTLGESALPLEIIFTNQPLPVTANGKLDPKPLQEEDLSNYEKKKEKILCKTK